MKTELKVGDKVRITDLYQSDRHLGINLGDVFTLGADKFNPKDFNIKVGDTRIYVTPTQLEKVEETVKMESNVKVGDTIKVINTDSLDRARGISVDDKFTVVEVEYDGYVRVDLATETRYPLSSAQFEVVSSEMNYAEMTAKLLAGEYPEGTEITVKDTRGEIETFNVSKNSFGYGLERVGKPFVNNHWLIAPSKFNGVWSVVKEEPIKEMTISDLQKQLGYKVKIVE